MRNEWEITRIGDLGRVITGKTPPTDTPENFYGKYLFITPRDMVGSKNVHITERTVSDRGASLLKNCILPAKAICVSCIGSDMGKVVMTTKESITNQQLNSVICKESYNPAFIYYAITNISEELRNVAFQSTAVPILNKSSFSDFTIFCPPLPTQKAIAHILGTLDDKIELLHQMNETLEAIARALFKSWFVDFDPVRKKAESLPTGLPPEIDALFPDCLEDSELGEIPKGWEIGSIKQFCTAINEQLSPCLLYTSDAADE